MFLVTTALDKFWDKDDDLLFLGPWCARRDRSAAWKNLRYRFLPDPWSDPASRRRAYRECQDAYDKALPAVAERLDAAHGERHPQRYWRIIVGPWLYRYIHVLRDRLAYLRSAYDQHPGIRTRSLAQSSRVLVRDLAQFTSYAVADGYNFQIFSQILDALAIDSETVEYSFEAAAPKPKLSALFQRRMGTFLNSLRAVGRPSSLTCDLYIPRRAAASMLWRSGLRAWPLSSSAQAVKPPQLPNAGLRAKLADLPAGGEFETLLARTLPDNFPWLYLEGYAAFREKAHRIAGPTPSVVFSANGWHYNETLKAVAAKHAENGARLVGVQHGGGYGMYEATCHEEFERSIVDSYWTWGWAGLDKDPSLRAVPMPRALPHRSPDEGRDILLICNEQHIYRQVFHSQADAWQFEKYLQEREAFLAALPEPIRRAIAIRPHKGDLGWRQVDRMKEVFPGLHIEEDGPPLMERLRRCRLVVVDHPATSFLDAFAADVPLILFWRKEVWDMRPSAAPFFDRLRAAGILHDEPASAAKAVAALAQDPQSWWQKPEVRDAYQSFRDKFARPDLDWIGRWTEALRDEVRAAKAGKESAA